MRSGEIRFHDSSINIWEENVDEKSFKAEVFDPIIRLLRKNGWQVKRDEDVYKNYRCLSKHRRYCRKGDLEAKLALCGRHIEFETYQNIVNVKNSNGGEYDFDKMDRMPYLFRKMTILIHKKIRDFLVKGNNYEVKPEEKSHGPGYNQITGLEWIQQNYRDSWPFKGDLTTYQISDYNRKSKDGKLLDHKQPVYFHGYDGKIRSGTTYYNINNMWWILCGKYTVRNICSSDIYVDPPNNIREYRCEHNRRKKLESLLAEAIKSMSFIRAELLKNLIFDNEPVYQIWSNKDDLWYRSQCAGYTRDSADAGKYTAAEVKRYCDNKITVAKRVA